MENHENAASKNHVLDHAWSRDEWSVCEEYVSTLTEDELIKQGGDVLAALHIEDVASYWGCGDYKPRLPLLRALRIVLERLGGIRFYQHWDQRTQQYDRELSLYEAEDYDGLLREGFIPQKEYEFLVEEKARRAARPLADDDFLRELEAM
jgi:hypothetical protein